MANIGKSKIRVPRKVKAGDVVEIKALVRHPMETGLRKNKKTGKKIPAHYINMVTATFNGATVMEAEWGAAVSADPYISFFLKVDKAGTLKIVWKDNKGGEFVGTKMINVQ
ncbi:MAG: thiosulfate oxidation carrier complex protein SoxZ [Magnetococcales bacterium]|nr:thiosulfate oxidation carrier complex protein SoxZ [Magnetococcales bacterium]